MSETWQRMSETWRRIKTVKLLTWSALILAAFVVAGVAGVWYRRWREAEMADERARGHHMPLFKTV